jgi:nucleoside-diphosphate-sugar epimerase
MKILFTGASSFTGYWFVKELAAAGHEVVATFRKRAEEYPDELRKKRIALAAKNCRPVYGCAFGDDRFLELIREGGWSLLCHHGADVTNYKSPDFNVTTALENNTHRLPAVLDALRQSNCYKVLLTGSVFENDEGAGSEGLPAFSPYGLSKALTWQAFRYYTQAHQMTLGKFVIPNPFGPFEEPRFTSFLIKNWKANVTPAVNTPAYVRDNIHVSLLAKVYAEFAKKLPDDAGVTKINPSGYAESQGAFALRFASEMRSRLNLDCRVELKTQTDFAEPRVRINTDIPDTKSLNWNESAAWDEIGEYYRS